MASTFFFLLGTHLPSKQDFGVVTVVDSTDVSVASEAATVLGGLLDLSSTSKTYLCKI